MGGTTGDRDPWEGRGQLILLGTKALCQLGK